MLDLHEKKRRLQALGATETDMESLLEYTASLFSQCEYNSEDDAFLEKWEPIFNTVTTDGAAKAVNMCLVNAANQICFNEPDALKIELYKSIGGDIPIITTENVGDFEDLIRSVIYKGREVANISEMGASFAFGKQNRFIILSNKPYSNVSAARMGLDDKTWSQKSMLIRKMHECAHYYTKRYFGSSRNNLHDELIADFNGLYGAFGEYKAEWFMKFLGLSEDSDGVHGRIKVYVKDLTDTAAVIIERLARIAADCVEAWTKTEGFQRMNDKQRIAFLCEKELLSYVSD